MRAITQNAAATIVVFMADATDPNSGLTGLTLTKTYSKNGGSFAGLTATTTDIGNGWYKIALTSTHTNTPGPLIVHCEAAGAIKADAYFDVTVADFTAAIPTVAAIVSGMDSNTTLQTIAANEATLLGRLTATRAGLMDNLAALDAAISSRAAAGSSMALSAVAIDLIWDEVIDGALSGRQLMRLLAATQFGNVAVVGSAVTIRDVANTKNRITATGDDSGNRAVTALDAS